MASLRFLIADDHALFTQSLAAQLALWHPGCHCEQVASLAALKRAPLDGYDLAIIDLSFGDGDALVWLRQHAAGRVLVATAAQEEAVVTRLLALEVDGVVHKSDELSALHQAVEAVLKGGRYLSPRIRELQATVTRRPDSLQKILSPREFEVFRLIGRGFSTEEIAHTLGIRASSVSDHKKNLMAKLDVHNTGALVRCAIERGVARV